MKQNGIRQVTFAALLLACILTACGLSGGKHVTNNYPKPSAEQSAMRWLGDILMSDSGRVMSGLQLARLSEDHSIRMVNLPVCDKDVLPHMGTYRHDATGGTIVFRPYTNEKDTVRPICQADIHVTIHRWEDKVYADSAETECIQNRGNGILAIYRIVHGGGPNGGKHRCYEKHPDGYPEYWGSLISVYPGADSLVLTWGYEASKRVYRFVGE